MFRLYGGISHESPVFSSYAHEPSGEWVCKEHTWYTTRKPCITILYHVRENTWHYIIDAVHDGKVGWSTDEYSTVFSPDSDWLYFLWQGIKHVIQFIRNDALLTTTIKLDLIDTAFSYLFRWFEPYFI